jgi:thiol-disulfide isomerase/thioredoxin
MSHTYDAGTERVLAALRVAVHRDHRRRARRRRRALAVAVAAFTLSGAAVAATQDWWTDAPPATDPAVVDEQLRYRDMQGRPQQLADPALARTVARAPGATLIAAPTEKGGYCLIPQLPRKPGEPAVGAGLGFSCGFGPGKGTRAASTFGTLAAASEGAERLYVYGRMTHPAARAVDLGDAAGEPLRISLEPNGFFMATAPRSAWERLDDLRAEIAILDRDGQTIQRACVQFGPAPFSRIYRTADGFGRLAPAPCVAAGRRTSAPPHAVGGVHAPALSGTDVFTGERFTLEDVRGRPVVIQFWERNFVPASPSSPTHGTVRSSLDDLYVLAKSRPELGVVFVAINEDPRGLAGEVPWNAPPGFVHLRDRGREIADAFGVERFPALVFLDAEHRIRAKIVGVPTQSELMRGVRIARATR